MFIGILLLFIIGCSNGIDKELNKIIVQKRIGESNKYEEVREIQEGDSVKKVKTIINRIIWQNIEVKMEHPPNYKFHFEGKNEKSESNKTVYSLWISPNRDKVELIVEGEKKYVELKKDPSADLFEIITDTKLTDKE